MLVIVPVKKLSHAKCRLSGLLTSSERGELSRAMTRDVLTVLQSSSVVRRAVVCGEGLELQTMAEKYDAEFINETELMLSGLNGVSKSLESLFLSQGEAFMLVVHADIPVIQQTDLLALQITAQTADVVITPDKVDLGSNILGWRLGCGFIPQFGESSFPRHQQQAMQRQLQLKICRSENTSLDIDTPHDLFDLLAMTDTSGAMHTLKFLRSIKLESRLLAYQKDKPNHLAAAYVTN